ncbi:hypothetical protein [Thermoactinospora rubra]|uniref:hypothetical protein n=1 Tax=Thermoactinospora rubra TaxID=1088767 RepID=UPI000A116831|nr:hypothetical protein [Thermoactinospora rubra]
MTEQLLLSHDGLQLLLESEIEPFRPQELSPALAEQHARLREAGLLDDRGRVPEQARPALDTLRKPVVRLEIEAAVGRVGRRWYAAMGDTHAVIVESPSPALGPGVSAEQVAGFAEPPPGEFAVRIVERAWTPVAACAWLGVGPRLQRAGELDLPGASLQRRLVDPREPVPDGVDPELWAQPMLLWGLTTDPGGPSLLVLDAGATGLWAFTETGERARLTALPSYEAWRLILHAITVAYEG